MSTKPHDVLDLLAELRRIGIELRAEGDQLHVRAPKGAVTPEIASTIKARKAEIVTFLAGAAMQGTGAARISKAPRDGHLPLSSGQQRLWYLDQLDPGSSEYNMPLALELAGELDAGALRSALEEITHRHEALRTTFPVDRDGQPYQNIAPKLALELPCTDLEPLPVEEREGECQRLLVAWAREPFDLAAGPLVRARLIRLRQDAHVLFFMPHHMVYDGLSHEIFQRELLLAYRAQKTGKALELPELPVQYVDYAVWQAQNADSPAAAAQIEFWKQQLSGELPVLELPTKAPRPAERTTSGGTVEFHLDARLVEALSELGRKHGVTLFMVLLAGYDALLARFTGQNDIIIGTPIANRDNELLGRLIGFFANTIALRLRADLDSSFVDLLRITRDTCLGAYRHQDAPFDRVVAAVQPPRDRSRTPVFQCMFSLDDQAANDAPASVSSTIDLSIVGHRPCGTGASRTDLTMWLRRGAHGVDGTIEYNSDLFDRELIEQLTLSYNTLLAGALAAPSNKLHELPLLDAATHDHLVFELNATATPYPERRLLHGWFEEQATRTPNAPALTCANTTLTYTELNARANRLAHRLQQLGVGPDQRVAICLMRSLDMVIAQLAALKAGGAYVPLDPKYPHDRLRYMLEDSGAIVLIVSRETDSVLPITRAARVVLDDEAPRIAACSDQTPTCEAGPENLSYVIYTSGSTGKSKGVLVEHRNTANFFVGMKEQLESGGVWLNDTSISFDISVLELFGALGHGFHVIVRRELVDESESVPVLIERHRVTHFQCTPSQASMLVADDGGRQALRRLSRLLVGGEALPSALAQALKDQLRGKLVNVYGPTETTVWSTLHVIEDVTDPVSIGRPIANTSLYVLDAKQRLVPQGVIGELWIGGAGVTRGYHERPELTEQRFLPDPFQARSGRMYRTGDLVRYRPDGTLEYRGRTDFQVKLRGHRIELGEIESALRNCAGIDDAVVALREDDPGDQRLVAYVISSAGVEFDPAAYKAYLRQSLTEIMVPAQFVRVASFPLTPNGKVDRRALPKPEHDETAQLANFEAPTTDAERAIAETWKKILGVQRVGRTDSFFELGGHSLLAVRMVRMLQSEHGLNVSLGAVFAASNLQELAARVASPVVSAVDDPFVLPLRKGGNNLPLFCICGLHLYQPLAEALGEGQPVYGVFVPAEARLLDGASSAREQAASVPELAAEYIKAMRLQQPHGPYCLAGVSFGGVLAYEMAQQLTRQGEEVRVLGLFDALLPHAIKRAPGQWARGHLQRLAQRGPRYLLDRLSAMAERRHTSPEQPEDEATESLELLRERIYQAAMAAYDAKVLPYQGDAVVFRATDHSDFLGHEIDLHCGWSGLVQGSLALHHIQGTHVGMLAPPYVHALARALRPYLDRASRGVNTRAQAPGTAAVQTR